MIMTEEQEKTWLQERRTGIGGSDAVREGLAPIFKCITCGRSDPPEHPGDKRCAFCFKLHQHEKGMLP